MPTLSRIVSFNEDTSSWPPAAPTKLWMRLRMHVSGEWGRGCREEETAGAGCADDPVE
jgi:hypothetical protein